MTPKEKEIMWGGLFQRGGDHNDGQSYFKIWCATALLSALGFLLSWVVLTSVSSGASKQPPILTEWNTPEVYVFAVVIMLQTMYNTVLMLTSRCDYGPGQNYCNIAILAAILSVILWAAVASYAWLWYVCWEVLSFKARENESSLLKGIKWGLHFLNLTLIFHGILWDALFWWYTWVRARTNEAMHQRLLFTAERETSSILLHHPSLTSLQVEDEQGPKNQNTCTCKVMQKSIYDQVESNDEEVEFGTLAPLFLFKDNTFQSLSFYPYFPAFFSTYTNNNYYY